MNTLQTAVALVTAAIGLCTAWIGYRTASRKGIENRSEYYDVLRLENPAVSTRYLNVRRVSLISGVIGISASVIFWVTAMVLRGAVVSLDDMFLLTAPALGGIVGMIISFTYRTKPPSRVYKRAELDLVAASPNAFQRCIEAVTESPRSTVSANLS
jgi:hypothetical protein